MLTLEQCRRVLGETMCLDDDVLISLRGQLYQIAELAIDTAIDAAERDQRQGLRVAEERD